MKNQKIFFENRSEDLYENEIIISFIFHLLQTIGKDFPVSISKIKETTYPTPDFLCSELNALVEIKRITESNEEMKITSSTKNDLLSKIEIDLENLINHSNEHIFINILDSTSIPNRGKRYKSLLKEISIITNEGKNYGKFESLYFKIEKSQSSKKIIQVGFGGLPKYPTSESYIKTIKESLNKAKEQFESYESTESRKYTKYILFDNFYTYSRKIYTFIDAIKLALNQSYIKDMNDLNIYLRMNNGFSIINLTDGN
ncbi:hypothetical protein [Leptospira paudalimensis]|uniref:Uncharacterized protein n=1 Tax=Leptospira paudalimensis TaxID=2950024 RepID=A0ABT3M548_9LEPT|nr:hypothetical protein [Leptospira paudalimensis]MCW7503519.1 hypothetical protein [Leptospira paudalimensis]